MKRRSFLKGLAATAAVPAVASEAAKEPTKYEWREVSKGFTVEASKIEDLHGFGLAPLKAEGSSVNFDAQNVYNVGDIVTFEGQSFRITDTTIEVL